MGKIIENNQPHKIKEPFDWAEFRSACVLCILILWSVWNLTSFYDMYQEFRESREEFKQEERRRKYVEKIHEHEWQVELLESGNK